MSGEEILIDIDFKIQFHKEQLCKLKSNKDYHRKQLDFYIKERKLVTNK